jgi:WD40 repeat protein
MWDRASGRPVVALSGLRQKIWAVAVAPDGSAVVAAALDGAMRVFATTGVDEVARSDGLALAVGFDPQGKLRSIGPAGVGDSHGAVRLAISAAATTTDGRVLALHESGAVRLHDATGVDRGGPPVSDAAVIAITGDGQRAAIAHADATISLWDVEGWMRRAVLRGHTDAIEALSFDAAGARLVSAADDRTARIWSVENGAAIATLVGHTNRVLAARFGPDGGVVTGGSDRTVRTWQLPGGQLRATFDHDGEVFAVDPDSEGGRVAAGGAGGVYVWSADGALLARPLVIPLVHAVRWSPDGTQLVAASSVDGRHTDQGAVVVLDAAPMHPDFESAIACRLRLGVGPDARLEERTPNPCPRSQK